MSRSFFVSAVLHHATTAGWVGAIAGGVAASEWPGQHTQGRVLLQQTGVASVSSVSSAQSLSASQSQGSQSPSPAAAVSVSDTASRQQVEHQTVLQF